MKMIIKTKKTDILIVLFADLQANLQTYLKISEDMQFLLNSYAELRINYILFKIDADGENVTWANKDLTENVGNHSSVNMEAILKVSQQITVFKRMKKLLPLELREKLL